MGGLRSSLLRLQVRVVLYVLIVLGLFLVRTPAGWKASVRQLLHPEPVAGSLTLRGADLAPDLLAALVDSYRRDYPQVEIRVEGQGTAHALQALLDGEAGVGLLARRPTAEEEHLFVQSGLDRPICDPIALGGLVLLAAAGADSIACSELAALLRGRPESGFRRLLCEDPNLGIWDTLLDSLGLSRESAESSGAVVFARSRAELLDALRSDPHSVGMVSSFSLPHDRLPAGLAVLAVRGLQEREAVAPTYENLARGRYPLLHRLYVACRADATGEAAKFVTFAAGARGQRRIERAGYLPAQQFLREILLTDGPPGAS